MAPAIPASQNISAAAGCRYFSYTARHKYVLKHASYFVSVPRNFSFLSKLNRNSLCVCPKHAFAPMANAEVKSPRTIHAANVETFIFYFNILVNYDLHQLFFDANVGGNGVHLELNRPHKSSTSNIDQQLDDDDELIKLVLSSRFGQKLISSWPHSANGKKKKANATKNPKLN